MITDSDRKMLVPSLAEVIAALKTVQPPYTLTPTRIKVAVRDASHYALKIDHDMDFKHSMPVIELEKMRVVENGRESETWRVISMPDFYLG